MNYLNNRDFLKEIIISKGKGKGTSNYTKMIILIVDGLHFKLQKSYSLEYRNDVYNDMYISLHSLFKKFDYKKYDNALAYFTEVAKRSAAASFNENLYKTKNYFNNKNSFISLSGVYSL